MCFIILGYYFSLLLCLIVFYYYFIIFHRIFIFIVAMYHFGISLHRFTAWHRQTPTRRRTWFSSGGKTQPPWRSTRGSVCPSTTLKVLCGGGGKRGGKKRERAERKERKKKKKVRKNKRDGRNEKDEKKEIKEKKGRYKEECGCEAGVGRF